MGDRAVARRRHANRGVRARRAARGGSNRHPWDLSLSAEAAGDRTRIVLYTARGCHLCERARGVLAAEGVAYREVDITGDDALEAQYREWVPVVEVDGERAFVYHVQPDGLRRKLRH